MDNRFLSTILLVGLSICGIVRGESGGFHLDLNRPDPKAGDEADRTIQFVSTSSDTNSTRGQLTVTNSFQFLELKGREKIQTWDVSNDLSEVEMVVNHLVTGNGSRTNELLQSGNHLVGTSILGEPFFRSVGRPLSSEVYRQLSAAYNIRPRNFNEFAHMTIPQPVSVGETWEITTPVISEMMNALGASSTNSFKTTGQFVGTTNLFGFNCFHLRFYRTTTETPRSVREIIESHLPVKMNLQLSETVDLIVPFDASQSILMKSYFVTSSLSGEMTVDGRTVTSSQGGTTMRIVSEYRPILHP
jgi:hypothetical protein